MSAKDAPRIKRPRLLLKTTVFERATHPPLVGLTPSGEPFHAQMAGQSRSTRKSTQSPLPFFSSLESGLRNPFFLNGPSCPGGVFDNDLRFLFCRWLAGGSRLGRYRAPLQPFGFCRNWRFNFRGLTYATRLLWRGVLWTSVYDVILQQVREHAPCRRVIWLLRNDGLPIRLASENCIGCFQCRQIRGVRRRLRAKRRAQLVKSRIRMSAFNLFDRPCIGWPRFGRPLFVRRYERTSGLAH